MSGNERTDIPRPPTPWAVICQSGCGQVFLTREEYNKQMNRPEHGWFCPLCQASGYWDDDNYEQATGTPEPDEYAQHDYEDHEGEQQHGNP